MNKRPYYVEIPWRKQRRGFPYGDNPLTNEKYLEDRAELFRENGNGWWYFPKGRVKINGKYV
tara:strand:- start:14779 stop:14964 length:186 start_codon:yes stop_codon:yes gene_type:complete